MAALCSKPSEGRLTPSAPRVSAFGSAGKAGCRRSGPGPGCSPAAPAYRPRRCSPAGAMAFPQGGPAKPTPARQCRGSHRSQLCRGGQGPAPGRPWAALRPRHTQEPQTRPSPLSGRPLSATTLRPTSAFRRRLGAGMTPAPAGQEPGGSRAADSACAKGWGRGGVMARAGPWFSSCLAHRLTPRAAGGAGRS